MRDLLPPVFTSPPPTCAHPALPRPPNYFRFFCDKLLRSFAPRFLENVYRCRKISDVGCQQVHGGEWPGWAGLLHTPMQADRLGDTPCFGLPIASLA